MKIFAIADIHGEIEKLERFCDMAKSKDPALILIAGDLTRFGPEEDARHILDRLSEINAEVFAVAGNGDTSEVVDVLNDNNINIDKTGKKIGNIGLVGMGMPSSMILGGVSLLSYSSLEEAMEEIKDCEKKIMVSHLPPFETKTDMLFTEEHAGSEFVKQFVEEKKPDLLVCGHIHEGRAIDKVGSTIVVNPGALAEGYVAEIDLKEEIDIKLHQV